METYIEFTTAPLRVPPAPSPTPETGAEVEFRGIVRQTERGAAIAGLQYEAYLPMAERQLMRIAGEINSKWPCHSLLFIHRLGWVPVGEPSLYIRVSASHREQAFRFCMQLIDRLKQDVPVWKLNPQSSPAAAASPQGSG